MWEALLLPDPTQQRDNVPQEVFVEHEPTLVPVLANGSAFRQETFLRRNVEVWGWTTVIRT